MRERRERGGTDEGIKERKSSNERDFRRKRRRNQQKKRKAIKRGRLGRKEDAGGENNRPNIKEKGRRREKLAGGRVFTGEREIAGKIDISGERKKKMERK